MLVNRTVSPVDSNTDTGSRSVRSLVSVGLMAVSSVILSVAIVVFFNRTFDTGILVEVCDSLDLAAVTLMPYMISAAVSAITAIGIMTILPLVRMSGSVGEVRDRLVDMTYGDFTSRIRVEGGDEQIRLLTRDLNGVIGELGNRIAHWKIINRQQWDLLQSIRKEAADRDCDSVLRLADQMGENWRKIAAIEEQFMV